MPVLRLHIRYTHIALPECRRRGVINIYARQITPKDMTSSGSRVNHADARVSDTHRGRHTYTPEGRWCVESEDFPSAFSMPYGGRSLVVSLRALLEANVGRLWHVHTRYVVHTHQLGGHRTSMGPLETTLITHSDDLPATYPKESV